MENYAIVKIPGGGRGSNGVEYHQNTIGAIISSLVGLYDALQRRRKIEEH